MRISLLLPFALCLAYAASASAQPLPPKAATATAFAPRPYEFWSIDTFRDRAVHGARQRADGTAVPVAPGYFLVTMMSMGPAAIDMGANPRVLISDGRRMHPGEFVAVNADYHLGLIRADFRPPAYKLSSGKGTLLLGLVETRDGSGKYGVSSFLADSCVDIPVVDEDGRTIFTVIGCSVRGEPIPGVIFLDARGELVALLSPNSGGVAHAGVDAVHIRRFLDTYFASWGRHVKPKPSY